MLKWMPIATLVSSLVLSGCAYTEYWVHSSPQPTGSENEAVDDYFLKLPMPQLDLRISLANRIAVDDPNELWLPGYVLPIPIQAQASTQPMTYFLIGILPKNDTVYFKPMDVSLRIEDDSVLQPVGYTQNLFTYYYVCSPPSTSLLTKDSSRIPLKDRTAFCIYYSHKFDPSKKFYLSIDGITASNKSIEIPPIEFRKKYLSGQGWLVTPWGWWP
jgi:hypothetical protein